MPSTCKILKQFSAARCAKDKIKLSVLLAGTRSWPFCGPTNYVLEAQLGLVASSDARIRVGNETRSKKRLMFERRNSSSKMSEFDPSLIINEISAQVIPLSLHEYGSWVIRSLLKHCMEHQKRPVLEQLHDNVPSLVTDKYGSNVIEHVIEHGLPEDRESIVRSLQDDIMKYAQDKFGSLVIRKCVICGTAEQKKALFNNVCGGGPQTLQNARQLMADKFGHYVIEKFFEYGTDDQKAQLVDALQKVQSEL
uniref:PUM-HD domain-containing protein n=1 Tax=Globodera pallida TaxID=36090 RepID=A0A183C737_GLOPA